MLIIDWVFDKMGYTKKTTVQFTITPFEFDVPKITAKKEPAKKSTGKKAAPRKRRLG